MIYTYVAVMKQSQKIRSFTDLIGLLPENEKIILDVLRQIIKESLPLCKEKISYNVPFFYGNRGICIIWPAAIPGGGIKEGVLLGFWQGNRLTDKDNYLMRGTNKKVYYRVFNSAEEINEKAIKNLLHEAAQLDRSFKKQH